MFVWTRANCPITATTFEDSVAIGFSGSGVVRLIEFDMLLDPPDGPERLVKTRAIPLNLRSGETHWIRDLLPLWPKESGMPRVIRIQRVHTNEGVWDRALQLPTVAYMVQSDPQAPAVLARNFDGTSPLSLWNRSQRRIQRVRASLELLDSRGSQQLECELPFGSVEPNQKSNLRENTLPPQLQAALKASPDDFAMVTFRLRELEAEGGVRWKGGKPDPRWEQRTVFHTVMDLSKAAVQLASEALPF